MNKSKKTFFCLGTNAKGEQMNGSHGGYENGPSTLPEVFSSSIFRRTITRFLLAKT